ncbi:MAG TPA: dihydrofolate reductase family protein [Gaiellaceae bacterium]|nr:dihydrofolate reductase family protein [Gaiellaceae bacterium]
MSPLELLADAGGPRWELPAELERLYGGPLGFAEPCTIANFVQSLDGVVAIPELPRSNAVVADESESDRFVMALLRACADVVLVGSGTLLASPQGTWRADRVYPPAGAACAALRASRGRPEHPAVAVVTAGGSFDPTHPVLERGAVVLTTEQAAPQIAAGVPAATEVVAVNAGDAVDLPAALAALRERGHAVVLSEGGPNLFGSLLASRLVDELFLTVSPVVAGRATAPRLALVEGVELLPNTRVAGELRSLRRDGSHLFLRYALS